MNGEECFLCEKPMGNSLHTIKINGLKIPVHNKCNRKLWCPSCEQNYPTIVKLNDCILKKTCWKCGAEYRLSFRSMFNSELLNDFVADLKDDTIGGNLE